MKSGKGFARVNSAVEFAIENLERRVLLAAPELVHNVPFASPSASAAVVPWRLDYPAAVDSGREQLISVVKGVGVTELLTTPQNFANNGVDQTQSQQFGPTSLRLYSKADNSATWYETDINEEFDGQVDKETDRFGHVVKFARKDDQMAMDAQGNLYIEYSSDASALAVDRVPASMVQALAAGTVYTPSGDSAILDPANVMATGDGNYRPQLAVGSVYGDPTRTAVYVYGGDPNAPATSTTIWAWRGTAGDSFASPGSNPLWNTVTDAPQAAADGSCVGGDWSPMTVGGAGDLYASTLSGAEVYKLSWSALGSAGFTPVFAAPARGTRAGLVAYTSLADGATTLYSLTGDAAGHVTVASTPASGSGAWAYAKTPIDPLNNSVSSLRLAVGHCGQRRRAA